MNAAIELGPDALDFWIGDWVVSWPGGSGTNQIRRILGGKVVEEVFECHGDDGPLYGRSHSVLDTADGRWKQTWVDSTGAYLDFVGILVDGRISFQRSALEDHSLLQRMVWLDVHDDSFRWEWQRSTDSGVSWQVSWPLAYRRVGQPG
ncbi:MAG: hypothetical protein QOH89_873 [Pseudonocardiales bacterium]|jgi:hypothetical protein|nr:hypothetical protein [Pseudonocardiales bacterium]